MRRQAAPPGVATVSRFALVSGLAALGLFLALSVFTEQRDVLAWEIDVVEVVVDLPAWLLAIPRLLMHISTRFTVPLLALLAYLVTLRWRPAAAVMAAFVVGAFPSWLGKHLVDRPRPARLQDIPVRDDFYGTGYPSGHVTIAVATAAVLVPYLLELPRTRRQRRLGRPKHLTRSSFETPGWLLATIPFAMAAGVALGRVYVGAHYPLDIVGGALTGLFGAWVVLALPHFQPATPSSIALLPGWAQRLAFRAQNVASTIPVLHRWVQPPVPSPVAVDLREPQPGPADAGYPSTGPAAESGTPW